MSWALRQDFPDKLHEKGRRVGLCSLFRNEKEEAAAKCLLSRVRRASRGLVMMSAIGPKRTLGSQAD